MKIFAIILCITGSFQSFSQSNENEWESKADSIISTAMTQLGVDYKYATKKPGVSFDCSGFTSYVYGENKVTNMRSSRGYASLGKIISLKECRKGDVILFTGTDLNSRTIGHVGIVVENGENGLKFIHCSSSTRHGGVVISELNSTNYKKRFLQVRRLF